MNESACLKQERASMDISTGARDRPITLTEQLISLMKENHQRTIELARRAGDMADQLIGGAPQPDTVSERSPHPTPTIDGAVFRIQNEVGRQSDALDELNRQLRRLSEADIVL